MQTSHISVFVINLLRNVERREFIDFQLSRLGIHYTIFNAVDGSQLPDAEKHRIQRQRDRLLYRRAFTDGEIGCMLSHMKLYEHIVNTGIEAALILEDDVFVSEDIVRLIDTDTISSLPALWDVVLLAFVQRGNIHARPAKQAVLSYWNRIRIQSKSDGTQFLLGVPVQFCYHTAGYLVSRRGAQKFITHGYPLRMPADVLTGNALQFGMTLYATRTPVVFQHSELARHSTVKQSPHVDTRVVADNMIMRGMRYTTRLLLYAYKLVIMCARGHAFPIVFLRKLGIIPPDKM